MEVFVIASFVLEDELLFLVVVACNWTVFTLFFVSFRGRCGCM